MDSAAVYSSDPKIIIRPSEGLLQLDLRAVWQYRELMFFLIWRDVKVRYKQTAIGVAWAIIQPLITMVIFTGIFSYVGHISVPGMPYALFVYAGILPWNFMSQAVTKSGTSLVGEAQLISKIYFPRLIVPIAAVIVPAIDLFFSFLILLVLMVWFGIAPGWQLVLLPLFVAEAIVLALTVSLWFSSLHVRYRDVGHAIPFLVQIWMYVSPIVYPMSVIPENWRGLYSLNPIVSVVEGFRWAVLGTNPPSFMVIMISSGVLMILLVAGVVFFKKMERTFADVI
jgi:lipopolysaccharide transport system permease protein